VSHSNSDAPTPLSRRAFVALAGTSAAALTIGAPLLSAARAAQPNHARGKSASKYPIGLELYSVRGELARDLPNTLRTVAQIGYQVVEFYAPYLEWTLPYAKGVRTQLDNLGVRCYSTHNPSAVLTSADAMAKAIEINQILGARHLIIASLPPSTNGVEEWTRVAGQFAAASKQLEPHGLLAGFHNHRIEWSPLAGGRRVMDVIADNTPPEFVLQFDVGTCLEAGADPIAWIKSHPGRIRSVHLKDWAPGTDAQQKGYRVLFGEGVAPWKEIFAAVESVGGVEFYLMEQEGSRYSELDTARRCLESYRALRGDA
jgi:sugar phosphate isomerase/epimerase